MILSVTAKHLEMVLEKAERISGPVISWQIVCGAGSNKGYGSISEHYLETLHKDSNDVGHLERFLIGDVVDRDRWYAIYGDPDHWTDLLTNEEENVQS